MYRYRADSNWIYKSSDSFGQFFISSCHNKITGTKSLSIQVNVFATMRLWILGSNVYEYYADLSHIFFLLCEQLRLDNHFAKQTKNHIGYGTGDSKGNINSASVTECLAGIPPQKLIFNSCSKLQIAITACATALVWISRWRSKCDKLCDRK